MAADEDILRNLNETSPLLMRSQSAPHSAGKKLGVIEEDVVKEDFAEDEIGEEEDLFRRRQYSRFRGSRWKRSSSVISIANMLLNQLDGPDSHAPRSRPKEDEDDEDSTTGESRGEINVVLPGQHISAFDVCRLLTVGLLYLLLAGVAAVAIVYSVLSILKSVETPVRSVVYQRTSSYPPISIVIVPDFSTYLGCYVRYYDDISPHPAYNSSVGPKNCVYSNVSFSSLKLNLTRNALVFQSPVDVADKQILCINFTINTTVRDYSAIEYWMFGDWDSFNASNETDQELMVAQSELIRPVHTFPAGMRTLIKLSKIVEEDLDGERSVRFQVEPNFARYNKDTSDSGISHLQVMFEWSSPVYELYKEVLPISFWSAVGSICGVLITIWKLAEIGTALVKKLRRERKKIHKRLKRKEREKEKLEKEFAKTNSLPSLPEGATFNFV